MSAWHRLYRKNPGVGGTHLSSSSASSSAAPWKKFAATATVLQWPHWFHKLTFCPPRCSLWHLQGPHRCHNQLPIASASPQTVLNFTLLCFGRSEIKSKSWPWPAVFYGLAMFGSFYALQSSLLHVCAISRHGRHVLPQWKPPLEHFRLGQTGWPWLTHVP